MASRYGLRTKTHRRKQPHKSKLALNKPYCHFHSHLKQLYISNKMEHFNYKGRYSVHRHHMCIDEFKRKVGLGYR